MKPFDLEAAKNGAPVCTREGNKAMIVDIDEADIYDEYPITVEVYMENGKVFEESFTLTGRYYGEDCVHGMDLMMEDEE